MSQSDVDQELVDAAQAGAAAQVSALLAEGADPMRESSSALRWAAKNGHGECVRLLLPMSDPTAEGSDALRLAAANGHAECVRLLLPFSDPKSDESWALRWAAHNGHVECVRLLLGACGPLIGINGLLEQVFYRGHAKVAAVLIGEEPRLLDKVNLPKCLAAALEKGHGDVASYLSSLMNQKELSSVAPDASRFRLRAARL